MISEKLVKAVKREQKRKIQSLPDKIARRKAEAFQEALRLTEEFKRIDPNLEKIVLFGSLARDSVRNLHFDIDLSFVGKELYCCTAIAMDSVFKVDLVDYTTLPHSIQKEIDEQGVVLYDSKSSGGSDSYCAAEQRVQYPERKH